MGIQWQLYAKSLPRDLFGQPQKVEPQAPTLRGSRRLQLQHLREGESRKASGV